jgi:hypothetical protein
VEAGARAGERERAEEEGGKREGEGRGRERERRKKARRDGDTERVRSETDDSRHKGNESGVQAQAIPKPTRHCRKCPRLAPPSDPPCSPP